jgi:hypothetical protein
MGTKTNIYIGWTNIYRGTNTYLWGINIHRGEQVYLFYLFKYLFVVIKINIEYYKLFLKNILLEYSQVGLILIS